MRSVLAPLMFLLLVAPAIAASPRGPDCLDAAAAHALVEREHLLTLREAAERAKAVVFGDLVSADLCRKGGRLVYVFAIMAEGGRVHRVVIGAQRSP